MKDVVNKLYVRPPRDNVNALRRKVRRKLYKNAGRPIPKDDSAFGQNFHYLQKKFFYYTIDNLDPNVSDAKSFREHIESRIGEVDAAVEGFSEESATYQRDQALKFFWGHNHDFGDFALSGNMGDRHLSILAELAARFPMELSDFADKDVLDIGCWTGGTTLALASLNPRSILAVEEVVKYCNMAKYLSEAFGLQNVDFVSHSLYKLNASQYMNKFDVVFIPGVIYHLTDPVIALRIIYNCLRKDGIILLESAATAVSESVCTFQGSGVVRGGKKEDLSRTGWNWFIPSPKAMARMLLEAGFDTNVTVEMSQHHPGRLLAFAQKTASHDICRAGLSVPDIP